MAKSEHLKADGYTIIILAGGESRRMKQDKRLVMIDHEPMITKIISVARTLTRKIIISSNDILEAFGDYPVIPDLHPGEGPLGGLVSVFPSIETPFALLLSCDMPWITRDLLIELINQHQPHSYNAFLVEERVNPFPALIPSSVADSIVSHFLQGTRSFKQLFEQIPVHPATIPPHFQSSGNRYFANLNSPGDLP